MILGLPSVTSMPATNICQGFGPIEGWWLPAPVGANHIFQMRKSPAFPLSLATKCASPATPTRTLRRMCARASYKTVGGWDLTGSDVDISKVDFADQSAIMMLDPPDNNRFPIKFFWRGRRPGTGDR
jgi:hypothetical protein